MCGSKGTGKTTKAKEILAKYKRSFTFDFQNSGDYDHIPKYDPKRFQDHCRICMDDGYNYDDFINIVEKDYFKTGALIVCEESAGLFPSNQLDFKINKFLLSCRHEKINFLFIFHNPRQIPPFLVDHTDAIIVKRTEGGESHYKKKFPDKVYDLALECQQDFRKTFTLGLSSYCDIFISEYFDGESLRDKIIKGNINK